MKTLMFVLTFYITIGDFAFARVKDVEVKSSWKTLSDAATLELPNLKKLLAEKVGGANGIKTGDPVLIQVGYGNDLVTEFNGFVRRIDPNIPLKLECEDSAFLLRKNSYATNFKDTKLSNVLDYLLSNRKNYADMPLDLAPGEGVQDIKIDKMRLDNVNGVYVLEKLKEMLGIAIYFRNGKLYAGLPYTLEPSLPTIQYEYGQNIQDAALTYRSQEDRKVQIKAVGIKKDNKRIEAIVGDADGDVKTLHKYNVTDVDVLKRFATEELKKIKFDGYEGGITTWGRPFCQHSYVAEYTDPAFSQRNGRYFIDEVVMKAGQNGYKREVAFGLKLNV